MVTAKRWLCLVMKEADAIGNLTMINVKKPLFCMALMACSAFSSTSFAQVGVTYDAGSPWSIEAVEDGDNSNKSYCLAARQYRDGTILTFAKNRNVEMSLAVDFPKPRFKEGQNLQVVMDPGANQLREYDIQSASDHAFVVRLGYDQQFMDALSRTGFLRVEAQGESLNFSLSGIDELQTGLTDCLASTSQDIAVVDSVPIDDMDLKEKETLARQAMDSALKKERDKVAKLQTELSALRAENLNLGSRLTGDGDEGYRHSQEYLDLRDENAALKVKLGMVADNDQALSLAQRSAESLRVENERLEREVSAAQEREVVSKERFRTYAEEKEAELLREVAERNDESVAQNMFDKASRIVEDVVPLAAAAPIKAVSSVNVVDVVAEIDPRVGASNITDSERDLGVADNYVVRASDMDADADASWSSDVVEDETYLYEAQRNERRMAEKFSPKVEEDALYSDANENAEVVQSTKEIVSWKAEPQHVKRVPAISRKVDDLDDDLIVASELMPDDRAVDVVENSSIDIAPSGERGVYYSPNYSLEAVLNGADIAAQGQVHFVEQASNAQMLAYQWQTGSIFGAAEQGPFRAGDDFDMKALAYLNKTEARCPGEFAAVPDQTEDGNGVRVDSYEIACISNNVSSTASILFFSKDGTFTTLTHEAPAQDMERAMEMKERVFSYLLGGDRLAFN